MLSVICLTMDDLNVNKCHYDYDEYLCCFITAHVRRRSFCGDEAVDGKVKPFNVII